MTESRERPSPDEGSERGVHSSGKQGADEQAHGGAGAGQEGTHGDAQAGSGKTGGGGYSGDLDPKKDMPRMPTDGG